MGRRGDCDCQCPAGSSSSSSSSRASSGSSSLSSGSSGSSSLASSGSSLPSSGSPASSSSLRQCCTAGSCANKIPDTVTATISGSSTPGVPNGTYTLTLGTVTGGVCCWRYTNGTNLTVLFSCDAAGVLRGTAQCSVVACSATGTVMTGTCTPVNLTASFGPFATGVCGCAAPGPPFVICTYVLTITE